MSMSALGHKQTYAVQNGLSALPPIATAKADMPHNVMSALPPKADMCGANRHVCFGPKADVRLLDYHIGASEKCLGYGQSERFGRLKIDDKFKFCRLLDWHVGG
jgi:hypothetical protein